MEDRAMIKHDPAHGTAMALTEKGATALLQKMWPGAPKDEIVRAAILCAQYGLNPLKKHVFLLPFKGRDGETWATVLGIQATRLIASRSGAYSYVDGPRVMTAQDQERIFGEADTERICAITIVQDERGNKAPGYGFWPKATAAYGADKGNSKANMAMIRSERAALDRLRPGEMPAYIEVMDTAHLPTGGESPDTYIDSTGRTLPEEPDTIPGAKETEFIGNRPLDMDAVHKAERPVPLPTMPPAASSAPSAPEEQRVCPIHVGDKGEAVYMAPTGTGNWTHQWGKVNCVIADAAALKMKL